MDLAKGLLISQSFITLESWSGAINSLEERKIEMHMWETGKEIIWGSEKGREENSTESLKLDMEKARRWSIEELRETSPQPTMCFWGCFTAFSHFQTLPFLPLRLVYLLPSLFILALCPLLTQFSASLCYQSNLKGFLVIPVAFHCCVKGISKNNGEPGEVINIFLFLSTVIVYSTAVSHTLWIRNSAKLWG